MTATRRSPGAELKRFLGAFSPEMAKVALRVRAFVLAEAPLAHEQITDASNAVAMGYSLTDRPGDAFCHIAVTAQWVNLGFNRGSQLPDPDRLLQGSGRWIRHLRIESLDDLHKPHVGRFIRAAMKDARGRDAAGSIDRAAPRSVVRAVYKKKRRPTTDEGDA
ncbi:MAG: DUF1801 domain-containing protein [Acidobacteriota bacterium]